MKGLMLKDIMALKSQGKILLLILAFFLLLATASGGITAAVSYLSTFLMVFSFTWIMAAFSADNMVQWDVYALSTPQSRRSIVLARYLLVYGMMAGLLVLLYALLLLQQRFFPGANGGETAQAIGLFLPVFTIVPAILLPLLYRFGPEKSRFLFILLMGIPLALSFALDGMNLELPALPAAPAGWQWAPPALIAAAVLLCAAVSFLISARIYEKKEF